LWIWSVAMFYIPLMKGKVVFQLIFYVRYFCHVVSQRLLTFYISIFSQGEAIGPQYNIGI